MQYWQSSPPLLILAKAMLPSNTPLASSISTFWTTPPALILLLIIVDGISAPCSTKTTVCAMKLSLIRVGKDALRPVAILLLPMT